jgi:hypothetical protein
VKLNKDERERIARGDMRFLKAILLKELQEVQEDLMVYKESRGRDDFLKGRGTLIQELIKVLES